MNTATATATHRLRHHLSVAILGALLSTAACGNGGTSSSADRPPTTATTTAPSTSPTTSTSSPSLTTQPTATASNTSRPTTLATARPTATFDELVGLEGAQVHMRCTGSGAATVLLISGFEAGSVAWAEVEPALSARTRVCSHDRPGTGTSAPATAIATFTTQAHDLHDLLSTIGEPGPFVVVGHSFGGAEAVTFASEFRDEVTGLVLVDASPVTWPDGLCTVADDGSSAATVLRGVCDRLSDPMSNAEHLDVFAGFAGAATITSLGSLPMAVITAVDRQLPAGLSAAEVVRLTDVWDEGQRSWSHLSTGSRLVPVDDTSHDIQLDHPDVVIDEIVRLLP
jgi:pimeloyl-ACP methyl ester carboxylesterase